MFGERIFHGFHHERFRHRGAESARIETLSDAVFAFSVSLLVASLEVPQTYDELFVIVKGVLPFFATVAILFLLWYQQYVFFRHYGMTDIMTVVLNLVYLAVILFYLYPLKFLFSLLLDSWTGIDLFPKAAGRTIITAGQFSQLIILYGTGYGVIWILLYAMHQRALHFSFSLQLNRYELLYTKKERRGALMNAIVGLLSALIAWIGVAWVSSLCYFAIPFVLILNEKLFKKQIRAEGLLSGKQKFLV